MSHVFHEGLPDYDPEHVLHDGCDECERRAEAGLDGLLSLDHGNTLKLWRGMVAHEYGSGPVPGSAADYCAMRTLYLLSVFLERAGLTPEDVEQRLADTHERLVARMAELWGQS